jgi:aryl-alcohol dehydrogenase-like predicted oxidoreductase
MERIQFGGTGIEVSRVVLGTWVTGGWAWGGSDERDSIRAILRAFELGIDFVDTAPVYGFGKSEEIVGKALKEWGNKGRVIVATKCGLEWNEKEQIGRNSTPERIRYEIEQSLRRLGVDAIDLYQIHWPDTETPFEQSMEALMEAREAGKIRHIGLSNFSTPQVEACRKAGIVSSLQPPFNIFEREAERELLPYCKQNGMATLVYGGLCRGLLSGKFTGNETFPQGDIRRADPKFKPDRFKQYVKAVEMLKRIAEKYNRTMAQFALRWALQQPGVTTVIAGARTAPQVEDNAGVSDWLISGDDLRRVDEILQKHIKTPVGPEFMAPR